MLAEAFLRSGKVRDLYELPNGQMLLVASDRISAFDVILPNLIPDKGRVLTGLSRFWFRETAAIVPNHLRDTDLGVLDDVFASEFERRGVVHELGPLGELGGRVMVCRRAEVLPIEAVVRGYLSGSAWKEYQAQGTVNGTPLPSGLHESDRLPVPLFTPAMKAEAGAHDENIGFDEMVGHLERSWPFHLGADVFGDQPRPRVPSGLPIGELAARVRDIAVRLYGYAAAIAERQGLILADTKFEFGLGYDEEEPAGPHQERIESRNGSGSKHRSMHLDGTWSNLILIDEALTPDSSRYWDAATYAPGGPQASFDKQFVRDWLERQPWDKTAPGPELPPDLVAGTRQRYVDAYERITGASFDRYLADDVIAP